MELLTQYLNMQWIIFVVLHNVQDMQSVNFQTIKNLIDNVDMFTVWV
jgi:hypothetical protein